MPSKIDSNATEVPMGLNDMAENLLETNNDDVPIDHSATAPEQTHITPGSPKTNDN